MMRFYFRDICGNHLIWGAKDVLDVRIRHVGQVRDRFKNFHANIRSYLDSDTSLEQAQIRKAKTYSLGDKKEDVLDFLFGKRNLGLTKGQIDSAYESVVPEIDGDPRTVWGFVQGLTRYSQDTPYQDERAALDRVTRKVMELAF